VGSIELQVPRVRDGSIFPSLLEPRRRAEKALMAVVQEAYVQGISTRRVDDLVQALGMQGISKSQVSRRCAELDKEVERFRTRKLKGPYPYVWLDGTFVKVRESGRVVSQAIVIAIAVTANGEREVLGLDVGPSGNGAFWLAFLRALAARGLKGVELVTSDAHAGLKAAIGSVLQGASWQRCRVHYAALRIMPRSGRFQFRFGQTGRHNQRGFGQTDRFKIATVWQSEPSCTRFKRWRYPAFGTVPPSTQTLKIMPTSSAPFELGTGPISA
jgi:transposase-like protein